MKIAAAPSLWLAVVIELTTVTCRSSNHLVDALGICTEALYGLPSGVDGVAYAEVPVVTIGA